jgi:subtilisin family serine protease
VIAVTATNAANQLLAVANRGRHIALAAPGVDVLVPSPNQTYQMSTGTSVAAAQVSGIAALLIELQPTLTPDQIREILQSTATDLGRRGPMSNSARASPMPTVPLCRLVGVPCRARRSACFPTAGPTRRHFSSADNR